MGVNVVVGGGLLKMADGVGVSVGVWVYVLCVCVCGAVCMALLRKARPLLMEFRARFMNVGLF